MSIDVTEPVAKITEALAPIAAIGVAVLGTLVAAKLMHWVRAPLDEEGAFHEEFMASVCPECGGDMADTDDSEIVSGTYCRDCGFTPEGYVDDPAEELGEVFECDACGWGNYYSDMTEEELVEIIEDGCPKCAGLGDPLYDEGIE